MDKLKMAHEMACAMIASNDGYTINGAIAEARRYADAVQAEADKRNSGVPEAILNSKNSSQLDDCDHHWKELIDHKICRICNKQEGFIPWAKDWQPDWSVAPEWANWWSITKFGQGHWFLSKPKVIEDSWVRETRECKQAPSFNYQGDWKYSLRKRPEIKANKREVG